MSPHDKEPVSDHLDRHGEPICGSGGIPPVCEAILSHIRADIKENRSEINKLRADMNNGIKTIVTELQKDVDWVKGELAGARKLTISVFLLLLGSIVSVIGYFISQLIEKLSA